MTEKVYQLIGGCGKFQIIMMACIFTFQFNTSTNILIPIFINRKQDIYCVLNDNTTSSNIDPNQLIQSNQTFIHGKSTLKYKLNLENCNVEYINSKCAQIIDYPDPMISTIRTRYELVCENKYLPSKTVLMFMIGICIGSIFGGFINDKFGRRTGCFGSYIMMAVFSTLSTYSPDFWTFSFARLLVGFAASFSFVSNSGIILEAVELSKRTMFGFIWILGYDTGYMILVFVAYFVRHEFYLQIVISCFSYLPLLYPFFYKESFRWLLTKERYADAKRVIMEISKFNNVNTKEVEVDDFIAEYIEDRRSSNIKPVKLKEVVNYPVVLICMVCLWFLYFSSSFSYYTFILGSGKVSKNIYVAATISAVSSWIVKFIYMILAYRVPRTYILISQQFSLFALFIIGSTMRYFLGDLNIYTTIVFMISISISVANFGFMWVYGGEAFPTVIRATTNSIGSAGARVAGMIASQTGWLFEVYPYLLPIVCTVMSGVGTLMAVFILPETFQKQSLDFLSQAEKYFVKWRQHWRQKKPEKLNVNKTIDVEL